MQGSKILITGGIKSGKSSYALELARSFAGEKAFVATAEGFDEAMKERIQRHQEERGPDFALKEEPLYLGAALNECRFTEIVVVDCLTVWLNNLFHHFAKDSAEVAKQIQLFLTAINNSNQTIIMVTNEIGLGVVSADELTRKFVDQLGILNQKTAELSDELIWMVSGQPQPIKGSLRNVEKN